MEEEKVYIFVSHSHRDIDKVRLVRNYLEEKGAEPILFFLKSVTDDNEVADLIKREIDARLWFLYCRSRNAENSNWVRTELDYVKKTGKKNFFEIDLDRDLSFAAKEGGAGAAALTEKVARRLDACIDDLKTLRRVFVSYSHYDAAVAEKLIYALEKYGIEALYDAKISAMGNWLSEIRSALDLAAREDGLTICLISPEYLRSEYALGELEEAVDRPGKKLFALLCDGEGEHETLLNSLPFFLREYRCLPVDRLDPDAAVVALMNESLRLFGDHFSA